MRVITPVRLRKPRAPSHLPAMEPNPPVEAVLLPRAHDVGGFEVRRALPAKERQMVGPFIFFP